MNNEKLVELRSVSKEFDGEQVLRSVSLDVHNEEFVTLLGPSGCGKTIPFSNAMRSSLTSTSTKISPSVCVLKKCRTPTYAQK